VTGGGGGGERALRERCAEIARRLHARGWVANHDGNVTLRLGEGRFLATPTATSKAAVTADNLIVVDAGGQRVQGRANPFGEIGLHLTVYRNRPDVGAVVHAHPPAATALACAGSRLLERPFLAEAVVSLGPSIATVPFAAPGADACAALAPFTAAHDAVLLASHGVLAWGPDAEAAYLRLELVEHLARVALDAVAVGGVKPLPESALPALLEARRKAGLGPTAAAAPAATAASPPRSGAPVVACAPSPTAAVPTLAPGRAAAPELSTIIREEVVRALRGTDGNR
jgi:L-fuculose-phosphate aldolase